MKRSLAAARVAWAKPVNGGEQNSIWHLNPCDLSAEEKIKAIRAGRGSRINQRVCVFMHTQVLGAGLIAAAILETINIEADISFEEFGY